MGDTGGRHRPPVPQLRVKLAAVLTVALAIALVNWTVRASAHEDDHANPATSPAAASATAPTKATSSTKGTSTPKPTPKATSTPRATSTPKPTVDIAAALTAQLTAVFGAGGDTWSVATLDLTDGQSLTLGATAGMYTGSITKLQILETLLRVRGGTLGAGEDAVARTMIENSDNDAALTLWQAAGGDAALNATGQLLGLTATQTATGGYFGVSTTSAADQIKVLHQLVAPTFLSAGAVAYARQLLGAVETDQRWGVPTTADAGTPTANKNGWLANDADNDRWLINSDGIVTIGGHQVLMVLLSQHQPDFATGVATLNRAAAVVGAALRS